MQLYLNYIEVHQTEDRAVLEDIESLFRGLLHGNENWVHAKMQNMPASKCQGGFVFRAVTPAPSSPVLCGELFSQLG